MLEIKSQVTPAGGGAAPPNSLLPFFLLLLMSENFPFSFCRMFSPSMNRSFLKKKMNQFYDECPAAWQELLDRRTNASPVALAKGYTASLGTTGLAMRIMMIKSVDGLSGGGWGG